jgi:hypothetical protein
LNGVIGEMDIISIQIKSVLGRGGSNIALTVPISFGQPINGSDKHIVANIKFPLVVKKGFFDIRL